ncbi:hypothetical protein ABZ782_11685 [Streptomyces asoensis]|uniref:hypothetical protein n=1 Tax=Streptomyces asoensis TaxID=249586 RepID=UPI00340A4059
MRTLLPTLAAARGGVASLALLLALAPPASAAGTRDITADVTADVLAGRDVTLAGDSVVTVPSGTTTYGGVLRGGGTPTVRGGGTLVLTEDGGVIPPRARQRQTVRTPGGNHGKVTLGGGPDLSAVGKPGTPARRITVLDHTGDAPTTGAFGGLRDGAEGETAGTVHRTGYRIRYRGADGDDVVLVVLTAAAAHPSATPRRAGDASDTTPSPARGTGAARGGAFGWWPYVLAAGLLGALLVPSSVRVRGGGGGGRSPGDRGPAGRGSGGRGGDGHGSGGRGSDGRLGGGGRGSDGRLGGGGRGGDGRLGGGGRGGDGRGSDGREFGGRGPGGSGSGGRRGGGGRHSATGGRAVG